jgi:hypothetical protein
MARHIAEAVAAVEPAIRWYRQAKYNDILPWILIKWGTVQSGVSRPDAERSYQEALDLATRTGERMYQAVALQRLAAFHADVDLRRAAAAWERALPFVRESRLTGHFSAASVYAQLGDYARAEQLIAEGEREALAHQKDFDREHLLNAARYARADLALYKGNCGAALREMKAAPPVTGHGFIRAAHAIVCGDSRSGSELRRTAQELRRQLAPPESGDSTSNARIEGALALLALHGREWDSAIEHATRGIATARESDLRHYGLESLLILRAAKHALHDRAAVARLTTESLEVARQFGFDPPRDFGGRGDFRKLWSMVE